MKHLTNFPKVLLRLVDTDYISLSQKSGQSSRDNYAPIEALLPSERGYESLMICCR